MLVNKNFPHRNLAKKEKSTDLCSVDFQCQPGVGLGLGADMSLSFVLPVALGVYLFEMAFSALWMRYFRFGPVEWVWRMLTYGQYLPLRKSE